MVSRKTVETNLIPRARDAEIGHVDMGVRVGEGGTNGRLGSTHLPSVKQTASGSLP